MHALARPPWPAGHLRNVFAKLGIASRHELGGFGLADQEWVAPAVSPAGDPIPG
jgi:hypothetical protein